MEIKIVEIRDHGTFIGAMAIRMTPSNPNQAYYLRRVGFDGSDSTIVLMLLGDQAATSDTYGWGVLGKGPRTIPIAHEWVQKNFDSITDGQVVDVAFILGETAAPKESERLTCP